MGKELHAKDVQVVTVDLELKGSLPFVLGKQLPEWLRNENNAKKGFCFPYFEVQHQLIIAKLLSSFDFYYV